MNGEEDEAETVKAVFAAARDTETDAEEYLLDDDWQMPEPEAVVFDAGRSGTSSEEPVTESSGLDDEAQQTLFSCTEFMAELPAVRRGRSRKRP